MRIQFSKSVHCEWSEGPNLIGVPEAIELSASEAAGLHRIEAVDEEGTILMLLVKIDGRQMMHKVKTKENPHRVRTENPLPPFLALGADPVHVVPVRIRLPTA